MNASALTLLRLSLIAVWLGSAAVSLLDWQDAGSGLLLRGGLTCPWLMHTLIWGGAGVDGLLGLLLWLRPGRTIYAVALGTLALMTLIASVLLPVLWLEPLGPLLKNLPIAAVLLALMQSEKPS